MLNNDPFLDFVIQEATKIGKMFIIDSGEGNEFIDPERGWDVEDLSGWLIDPLDREKFIISRKNHTLDEIFAESYVFAKWSIDNDKKLKITFKKY